MYVAKNIIIYARACMFLVELSARDDHSKGSASAGGRLYSGAEASRRHAFLSARFMPGYHSHATVAYFKTALPYFQL